MRSSCPRNCLSCKDSFVPSPNNRGTQRYCSKADCRKSSKAAAQRKWLRQPQNRSYFRGPENVARVQRWRKAHPDYWRAKEPPLQEALQDLAPTQAVQEQCVTVHDSCVSTGDFTGSGPPAASDIGPLQDLVSVQVPLLAGVISMLMGDALQDRFALFTRDLVDRGRRVLGREANPSFLSMPR
jgi:hypothetical protein